MRKNAKIGALVLIIVMVGVIVLLAYRVFASFSFYVDFGNAKKLEVGDAVYLRGLSIGEVADLEMPDSKKVRAKLKIARKHSKNIKSDCDFVIRRDSIVLGKRCIHIYVFDASSPAIRKGDIRQGSSLWKVYAKRGKESLKKAPDFAKDFAKGVADEIKEASPELRGKIIRGLAEVPDVMADVARKVKDQYPELHNEVQNILGKVGKVFDDVLGRIKERL